MNLMLALASSEQVVSGVIWLVCLGLVFSLLFWLVGYVGMPAPFVKIANAILAIAAVIVLINCIMTLAGHPLVKI